MVAKITAPAVERHQRILIIDDNHAIHEDVRKILGASANDEDDLDFEAAALFGTEVEKSVSARFEIDSAFQGAEGLEMVERAMAEDRPYAMAFVDVRMPPGWDGIETITRIWKLYPELQVVICTAYSDYSWEEMIRSVGKTDSLVILKKPFDNIEALQLAHTLTEKWALSRRLHAHLGNLDRAVADRTRDLQAANTRLRAEISEREEAQRELDRSEMRFAKAFQASPIPMAIQSLSTTRYLDVNDAFVSATGFRRLEVVGRDAVEIGLSAEPSEELEILTRLRCEESVRNQHVTLRTRDGQVRDFLLFAETIDLHSDRVALVAALDVSEQRKLEKQLRHAQKLEAVGQLAAGVAHDFNNILTVIQGHATMQLAAPSLQAGVADSFEQVSHAAERAAALTRQLLAFSRKQVVLPRSLCLNTIIRNLEAMLTRLIGEHIELDCALAADLPEVYADEANVEQIVVNIVVNARDAMAGGGQISVRTECIELSESAAEQNPQARAGQFARLSLSDTGCGMSAETLARIFEPFFTTKELGKGTGLGLATVYGIVAQHGGWIEVDSQIDRGTTFHIQLPLSGQVSTPAAAAEFAAPRGGSETILLVEDEPDVREIVAGILEIHGYQVHSAGDGPEALAVWKERADEIDLLVTDILMPNGIKGTDLAARLRAEKASLRVIYSSGYSPDSSADFALALDDTSFFLAKPYKLDDLTRIVRTCLDAVGVSDC
jgi:PAS domain S-box-containing protein